MCLGSGVLARRPVWMRARGGRLATCVAAELLPHSGDAGQNLAGEHNRCGHLFELVEADVAGTAPAVPGRIVVAKILDEMPVPTANARRIALHLSQETLAGIGELTAPLEHQSPLHEV